MSIKALTQTALTARAKLLARRQALTRLDQHHQSDGQLLRQVHDSEEQATNEGIAGVLGKLSDGMRTEVAEIDAALTRLENGTWGYCDKCGSAVGHRRLIAMPEARTCVNCAFGATAGRT
jgi:RNA polymerase-binding transcription factor DksA